MENIESKKRSPMDENIVEGSETDKQSSFIIKPYFISMPLTTNTYYSEQPYRILTSAKSKMEILMKSNLELKQ